MEIHGKEPTETNIINNDQITEEVNNFNYLENNIGYVNNYDIKLDKLQGICKTIKCIWKQRDRTEILQFRQFLFRSSMGVNYERN